MRARRLGGHIRAVLIFLFFCTHSFGLFFFFFFGWGDTLRFKDRGYKLADVLSHGICTSYDAHFVTVLWTFTLKNKNCARGFLKWEFLKQGFSKEGSLFVVVFSVARGVEYTEEDFFRLGFTYWDGPIKIGDWI